MQGIAMNKNNTYQKMATRDMNASGRHAALVSGRVLAFAVAALCVGCSRTEATAAHSEGDLKLLREEVAALRAEIRGMRQDMAGQRIGRADPDRMKMAQRPRMQIGRGAATAGMSAEERKRMHEERMRMHREGRREMGARSRGRDREDGATKAVPAVDGLKKDVETKDETSKERSEK